MSSLLDEGSSPPDNKAGSEHKGNETSESYFPKLKDNNHDRRRFLFMIGAIIACVILGVVLITIIVVLVYSQSSSSLKEVMTGLAVVPQEISFNPHDPSSYEDEVAALNKFMLEYNKFKSGKEVVECSDDKPAPDGKFCYFDNSWIYSICPPVSDWNYGSMNPCVLLSLWKVSKSIQVYDKYEELPETMPDKLKDHIWVRYNENSEKMPKNIWVSCTNEERYTDPARGFPAYYLPHPNSSDYLPPLVGVVLNLEGKANNTEEIECKLWAKNINHKIDKFATVKFTVLVKSD
nr:sodium/potassium-transporting ATPase subunit beta-like isoform X1 [Procambarus clarkii]